MSIMIHGMNITTRGCIDCPLAHRTFDGSETVLLCYAAEKKTSDDGERPDWCPMCEVITCKDCKYGEFSPEPDDPRPYFCHASGYDWHEGDYYCKDAVMRDIM